MAHPDAVIDEEVLPYPRRAGRTSALRAQVRRWSGRMVWFLAPLLVGLAAWEALARLSESPAILGVSDIASAWWILFERGEIVPNVLRTLGLSAIALGLAIFAGIGVGVAMARSPVINAGLRLYVDMLMAAPLVVFVPVFSAVLSGEKQAIIATGFIYCVFPILENARLGTLGVSPDLVAMARAFGASRRRLVLRVLVPAALPLTMTGVRIAASKAFKGVLLGEILITLVGLGGLIRHYGAGFRIDYVYALTATAILVALGLVAAMRGFELLLRRRFPSESSDTIMEA